MLKTAEKFQWLRRFYAFGVSRCAVSWFLVTSWRAATVH